MKGSESERIKKGRKKKKRGSKKRVGKRQERGIEVGRGENLSPCTNRSEVKRPH